jgi:hypothetical protein
MNLRCRIAHGLKGFASHSSLRSGFFVQFAALVQTRIFLNHSTYFLRFT